jgi:NAD(P)-dependent dehydrogenase (short-subunit alcohol dehydrogenase family)
MIPENLFDVSKEVVVITGVAGQLGKQYARAFLERNARVAGLDINQSVECTSMASEFPGRFLFCTTDTTDRSSLEDAMRSISLHLGKPTVLINNAAIDSPPSAPIEECGPYEEYPEPSWDRVMKVNITGVHLCCQVFGKVMAREGTGSIININSIYGVVSPDQNIYAYRRARGEVFYKPVAYSVSKSALLNLTRYLAVYWAKKGVRVNTLTIAGVFNNQEQAFLDSYCERIPIGYMANSDTYNGPVIFLASSASSYMTGANLIVDGGWTAI